ncbi:hypothetical protein HYR99_13685 [Candidatus Poribacteria bacterium]|nr:hypothetical protein [Candidatus Poribacteria bacterium]
MTIFDQRNQKVIYQYNAAGNINFADVQDKIDAIKELKKLQSEVSKAIEANIFDEETATDVEYNVKKAVQQAEKPTPSKKTLLDYLNTAKALVSGVKVASGLVKGLVEAVEKVKEVF